MIGWLAYATMARAASLWITRHWGEKILRLGDGKFSDVAGFLQHRFYEAAWLLTLTLGVLAVTVWVAGLFATRVPRLWRWVPYSLAGFIALNLWLKLAATTCLFWCFFWNGKGTTDNLAQFHIKLLLMEEAAAPVKVALGGSSQMHVQIDHRLLNRELGTNYFTMDLDFPSSRAYDFLFLEDKLGEQQANMIVCYLSELNFFSGALSDGFSLFFKCRDLPEFFRLGGRPQWSFQKLAFGLLGDLMPVFRLRDPIADRLLGVQLTGLLQRERNASLDSDLQQRAVEAASGYRMDAQSQFSFTAFDTFVSQCRAKNQTVVLCCGQLNPVLGRQLDPTLRPRMSEFLRGLAAEYSNVLLIEDKQLPPQSERDYEDLTHVGPAAQARFTEAVAGVLKGTAAQH